MSNLIIRNGQVVLWCRNRDMVIILNSLSRVVEEKGLQHDKNINRFLGALNQRTVGWDKVQCRLYDFFGEGANKTSMATWFELVDGVIGELETYNSRRPLLINKVKQMRKDTLVEKSLVDPDSIILNSVRDISHEFKTFFGSLMSSDYVVRGDVIIFKSDLTRFLTSNDMAYIEDCVWSGGGRYWYRRADSNVLSSDLIEISYQYARDTINECLEYRSPSQAESDNRKEVLWQLIGKHLISPVKKVYEWKGYGANDYIYYRTDYLFLTDTEALWFDMKSFD